MNVLQAEKLRDIINFVTEQTGNAPKASAFTDSTINHEVTVSLEITLKPFEATDKGEPKT